VTGFIIENQWYWVRRMDNSTPRDAHIRNVNFEAIGQERSEAAGASSLNPYAFIREWWGEELSDELVLRAKAGPREHLHAFLYDWETASMASENLFRSDLALPPLRAGALRPLVRGYGIKTVSLALSMSLYCHEVILENPLNDFQSSYSDKSVSEFMRKRIGQDKKALNQGLSKSGATLGVGANRERDKEAIIGAFHDLLILKPLVKAGIIHLRSMPNYADLGEFFDWIRSDDQTAQILFESAGRSVGFEWQGSPPGEPIDQDPFKSGELLSVDLAGFGFTSHPVDSGGYLDAAWSLILYTRSEGHVQLTINDSAMADRIRNALSRIGDVDDDLRGITMRKLLALSVPLLQRRIPDLISIRASEEVFADWRRSLTLALAQVADIQSGDTQAWNRQASAIVHAELEPFRQAFQDIAKTSPALRALQSGLASLGIEAIGASAGAAVEGGASGAFTGLVAGKAAHTLVSYLKTLKEHRSAKAVLDVAFMFDPKRSEPMGG
jgi:hypothetical protein